MPFDRRRGGSLMLMRIPTYDTYIAQLQAQSPLALWDAGSGVYSDAGTTPAEPDDPVQQWNDLSGNGHHVAQATADDRPLYRASVAGLNGKPGVEFISSDYLVRIVTSGLVANLSAYNVFIVFRTTATGPTAATMYSESSNAAVTQNVCIARVSLTIQGRLEWLHTDNAVVTARADTTNNSGAANGNIHLYTARRISSNSWSLRLDGTQVATHTGAPGTTNVTQLSIGSLIGSFNQAFFTGHIATLGLFPADNYTTIEPIIARYYGISLP